MHWDYVNSVYFMASSLGFNGIRECAKDWILMKMEMGKWGDVKGAETIIRAYFVRKFIFKNREKRNKKKQNIFGSLLRFQLFSH